MRCSRAPNQVLMMRSDFVSEFYSPQWRLTLRRFLLYSCRAVSPRPLPSRDFNELPSRVAASRLFCGPPHGFAQLQSSLSSDALPHRCTRSSLGFAFKQVLYIDGFELLPADLPISLLVDFLSTSCHTEVQR